MEYWNTIITEKSWNVLQKIKKEIKFILIGGWAAYLWTNSHKSKDIDIVVDYKELNKIKLNYNLNKNDALKKYEIKIDDIDIDIYLPFYSKLPLLEQIEDYATNVQSFKTLKPEALLVLKQAAEINRGNTEKGFKDRIDILNLLIRCEINFKEYNNIIKKENLEDFGKRLIQIITNFNEIKYLGLNPRQFKLKKEELIKKIKGYS
ncbi:hypothetical protein HYX02_03920 [Candidatus Woesearchaeota archaeon]|nr:hypothetical protein [Candidatus Woesearchaeota archaeon]